MAMEMRRTATVRDFAVGRGGAAGQCVCVHGRRDGVLGRGRHVRFFAIACALGVAVVWSVRRLALAAQFVMVFEVVAGAGDWERVTCH